MDRANSLLGKIETRRLWAYFDKDWLLQMRVLIRPQLPEDYHLFVESEAILITPDEATAAAVLPDGSVARRSASRETNPQSLSQRATAAAIEVEENCEIFNKYRLLIRRAPDNLVVAVLELLSPSNKGLGNRSDRDKHLRKRESLLDAGVNILEIDALVEGDRILPSSLAGLAEFERNAWSAFHEDGRRKFRGWGWNRADPPPVVSWRVEGEVQVLVDLPLALEEAREFNRWDGLVE